jgi:hypothetical protein
MNFTDPRFYLDIAVIVVSIINMLFTWLRKPGEDAAKAVKALGDKVELERQALVLKLQTLEERVAHMPTDEEIATLRGDVHTIKAVVEGQRELLNRVERQTNIIHDHLLNQSKR